MHIHTHGGKHGVGTNSDTVAQAGVCPVSDVVNTTDLPSHAVNTHR